MRRLRVLAVSMLCAQLLDSAACASFISIRVKSSSSLSNGKAGLVVNVTNLGDEPARYVRVAASLQNRGSAAEPKEQLDTNSTMRVTLDLGNAPAVAGLYIVPIAVSYEDGAGFPFSTVSSFPLYTADPDLIKEPVSMAVSSATIRKTGDIAVKVSLPKAAAAVDAAVTLVLSDAFACGKPAANIRLEPGAEKTLLFTLSKLSARTGSAYPVIVIFDYEEQGLHHSIAAAGRVSVTGVANPFMFMTPRYWITAIVLLLLAFLAFQFITFPESRAVAVLRSVFPVAVLITLAGFTLYFIPPALLLANTITAGGDTVSHGYLASHLKEQLFNHGRIISWANGWWCGFPLFQFYFCLPYLLMALFSIVIPFNIAFKLVSVAGIFILPVCAYAAGRIMRLPRPGPLLLAIAMIPFLFDVSNTMWGVNIYSTFAGMISNSLSFPIMLLFIACAWRDADDGRFRLHTVILLVLLVASHFFTSVIAALALAIFPFLRPKAGVSRAMRVLMMEGGLALLLMAWWLVPLLAKRGYSMDFGENWTVNLCKDIPMFAWIFLPLALLALPFAIKRGAKFLAVAAWMLTASLLLMRYGFDFVSPVFVNVRLWPFVIYSALALAAGGAALLLERLKATEIVVTAALLAALVFGPSQPNSVRTWAEWNYEGLEKKPRWQVLKDLVLPLDGTPGRLANDLSNRNSVLGSSRIFECVPHMIKKPILEGGIVNSAAGSMFSYYIQSETSDHCAGFPPIVKPTTFNLTNATKHLELFNVKHFIAVSPATKAALAASPDWRFLRESHGWQLYELLTHDGSYVFIPRNRPTAMVTADWKQAGLDWIYDVSLLDHPRILLRPGESQPPGAGAGQAITNTCRIWDEKVADDSVSFRTTGIGLPHIVKCTYYPNWKVRGAERVYMVTPCFMLVYPQQEKVELYYGSTIPDCFGHLLTVIGIALTAVVCARSGRTRSPQGAKNKEM